MSHETKAPFIGWPSRQSIGRRLLLAFAATTMLMALAATSASATYTAGTPLPAAGLGFGPSGVAVNQSTRDVYVARWGNSFFNEKGSVFHYSSSGTNLGCTFSPEPSFPGSVAVNPLNGNIYVEDVRSLVPESTMRTYGSGCGAEIGTAFGVEASNSKAISQSAVDSEGNLYFPNSVGGKLEKITPAGGKAVLISGLTNPIAAARDSEGHIFVTTGAASCSNNVNGRLKEYSAAGVLIGEPLPGLTNVTTLAIDRSTDEVFVGRGCGKTKGLTGGFRVEKYSAGFAKLDEFGGSETFSESGSIIVFNQLAVDETSGTVYAVDAGGTGGTGNNRVQVFNYTPPTKQTLTVNVTGEGSVTGEGIACPGDCSEEYDQGKVVPLSATPNAGHKFAGWSGACSGTGSCEVTMSEAKSVTATFEAIPKYALTVNVSGEGSVSGEGIACPGDCTEEYEEGKVVSLSQTPNAGQKFAGWSGACSGTGSCEVTMSEAKSVTATFEAKGSYTLSVNKTGSGSGRITSSPWGINCGTHCAYPFEEGTVTLSAAIAEGSTFVGWTGCDSNPTLRTCVVNLASNRSVTAEYTSLKTITVNKTGSGSGRVTSTPWGINCGTQCSHAYTTGTTLVLTAAVAEGSSFAGWTGCDAMPTLRTCEVSLNSDRTVTASYAQTHLLTVNKTGSGSGRVTSSPWGINCGAYCSVAYEAGTKVTLTAAVGASSSFGGWSGCDENPKPRECVVTMSADKAPTVTYNEAP